MHIGYNPHYDCNVNCSFCYQRGTGTSKNSSQTAFTYSDYEINQFEKGLLEALDKEEKNNKVPNNVVLECLGGELYCWNDGKIVDYSSRMLPILIKLRSEKSINFQLNLQTNLLYESLDDLLNCCDLFLKNNFPVFIGTSFDFQGRFLDDNMLQLWLNNMEQLIEFKKKTNIEPVWISTIITDNLVKAFKNEIDHDMMKIFDFYVKHPDCKVGFNKPLMGTAKRKELLKEILPIISEKYPQCLGSLYEAPLATDTKLTAGTDNRYAVNRWVKKEDFVIDPDLTKCKTSIKNRFDIMLKEVMKDS